MRVFILVVDLRHLSPKRERERERETEREECILWSIGLGLEAI
jgi:tryptophanyl-tRNA synthetase